MDRLTGKGRKANGMNGAFCATMFVGALFLSGCPVDSGSLPPTCSDNEKNNGETDVDCGGLCRACGNGKHCAVNGDCDSKLCQAGVCVVAQDLAITAPQDLSQPPADLTPPCPMGETLCNGACKNTQTDAFHCGGCGQACFQGQTCDMGKCVGQMGADAGPLMCPPGHADCDGDGKNCEVNTQTDKGNCGGCGNACKQTFVCEQGACVCLVGQTACNNVCVDTNTDPGNCGACGKTCNLAGGEKCLQGACVAPPPPADQSNPNDLATSSDQSKAADGGMAATDGAIPNDLAKPAEDLATPVPACDPNQGLRACGGPICTDISSDGKNCGGCNNICKQGSVCSFFSCVPGCKPGETDCNGSCTDLQTDGRHCGGCNTPCAVNSVCVGGKCYEGGCPPGFTTCGIRTCVNLLKDQYNCGACNKACAFNESCENGACKITKCPVNRRDCNGLLIDGCEINSGTDTMNCGACGNVCNLPHTAQWCWDGRCEVGGCFGTWRDCNGLPGDGCEADSAINLTHCGWCGNTCPAVVNGTRGCSGGICGIDKCNAGFSDCNASAKDGCEINTTSDSNHCGACGKQCKLSNATSVCTGGSCAIKKCNFGGWDDCNEVAADGCEINLAIDTKNCGACGNACTQGQVCQNGLCSGGCGNGFTQCGNACTNINTDPANCGGCGKACPQGQTCGNGACQVVNQGFSAKVQLSCQAASEAQLFYQDAGNGDTDRGPTPYTKILNQVEACTWGVEIAVRVDKNINMSMPWYGCPLQPAPSLATCTLTVNGVVVPLVDNNGKLIPEMFVQHPWACNNGGEGNIVLSLKKLSCPGA